MNYRQSTSKETQSLPLHIYSMPTLLPSSPTQRRNYALAPLVPLCLHGPINHGVQTLATRGRWTNVYLSCRPGIQGSSCSYYPVMAKVSTPGPGTSGILSLQGHIILYRAHPLHLWNPRPHAHGHQHLIGPLHVARHVPELSTHYLCFIQHLFNPLVRVDFPPYSYGDGQT